MKRVLWVLFLVLGIFVFRTNVLAADCGVKGKPCCINDKSEFDICTDGTTCVGEGEYPTCEDVGAKKNTCICNAQGLSYESSCVVEDNYCDRSGPEGGLQAFCKYNTQKVCGEIYDLSTRYSGPETCACKTQAEADKDLELNGYNRYHTAGTCAVQETRHGFWFWQNSGDFYIVTSRNYCGEVNKEARVYLSSMMKPYCKCVDKNLQAGTPDGNGRDITSKLVADPGTEYQGPNTILLKGSNVKMYCEDANGNIDRANPTVNTAFGCLPVSVGGFVSWAVRYVLGIVGGISFLMMVYGFILMSTSEGDPKKAQAAKDTITSAITGLVIAIFSIFLVRLIMLYVLKLPGVS